MAATDAAKPANVRMRTLAAPVMFEETIRKSRFVEHAAPLASESAIQSCFDGRQVDSPHELTDELQLPAFGLM